MGWIIATIIMAIDAAVGTSRSNKKQAQIQEQATEIAKQISKDKELVNNLYNAYIKRDARLASSLIGASPFGSYYNNTIKAVKQNDADIKEVSTEIERINKAEADLNSDVAIESAKHQTSGSAIIDLVSGTAQEPVKKMSYETSKFNKKEIK